MITSLICGTYFFLQRSYLPMEHGHLNCAWEIDFFLGVSGCNIIIQQFLFVMVAVSVWFRYTANQSIQLRCLNTLISLINPERFASNEPRSKVYVQIVSFQIIQLHQRCFERHFQALSNALCFYELFHILCCWFYDERIYYAVGF